MGAFFSSRIHAIGSRWPALTGWLSGLTALAIWLPMANALELAPMRMQTPSGVLHISNKTNRFMRIKLNVYPSRPMKNGNTTATLAPFPEDIAANLIQLRPSAFRLGVNSSKIVNYKVLNPAITPEFFVCAERAAEANEMANIRICSRWRPAP